MRGRGGEPRDRTWCRAGTRRVSFPTPEKDSAAGRPVFWLPDPPTVEPSQLALRGPVTSFDGRPRLQRRARAGLSPASRSLRHPFEASRLDPHTRRNQTLASRTAPCWCSSRRTGRRRPPPPPNARRLGGPRGNGSHLPPHMLLGVVPRRPERRQWAGRRRPARRSPAPQACSRGSAGDAARTRASWAASARRRPRASPGATLSASSA
jgi:hypothetical protein